MLFSSLLSCFPLSFCNCTLTERSCSPQESTLTSPPLTLHMCLQWFFSPLHTTEFPNVTIMKHSQRMRKQILSFRQQRCLFAQENRWFVCIYSTLFLNYASEKVLYFFWRCASLERECRAVRITAHSTLSNCQCVYVCELKVHSAIALLEDEWGGSGLVALFSFFTS